MPFPFVEAPRLRRRPALVSSRPWSASGFRLYWGMMITSVENAGWPDDIPFGKLFTEAGLPSPSVIRPAKIASFVEETASRLGRLPDPLLTTVMQAIRDASSLDTASS